MAKKGKDHVSFSDESGYNTRSKTPAKSCLKKVEEIDISDDEFPPLSYAQATKQTTKKDKYKPVVVTIPKSERKNRKVRWSTLDAFSKNQGDQGNDKPSTSNPTHDSASSRQDNSSDRGKNKNSKFDLDSFLPKKSDKSKANLANRFSVLQDFAFLNSFFSCKITSLNSSCFLIS